MLARASTYYSYAYEGPEADTVVISPCAVLPICVFVRIPMYTRYLSPVRKTAFLLESLASRLSCLAGNGILLSAQAR